MSGSRSLPIPPQPPLDLLRQMQSRGSAAQEFDPVAAAIAEQRRSSRRQPLPLPPMPPAVPPQRTGGSAEAGPPSVFPGETAGDAIPTRLGAALPPDNPWVAEAGRLAEKYNLPRDVFLSLVYQESRFNPEARSPKGAHGLAQLMPGTASDLKADRYDPAQNLEAGAQYLRQLYDRFGSMPLALAAYNAGPNRVARAGNQIPQILETQNYVKKVLGRAGVDGYAEGGPVRESLDDMEDRYADAPAARPRRAGPDVARILDAATGLSDDEYDRRLAERDPLMTPASRMGVAGAPVPRGGRAMYPGNAVSPFEAAAGLIPRPEDVQRGMMSAMAGIEIPEGGRIVQTDVTRSGYAIETADGRLIDPEGRGGRDVRDFAPTVRRSAVLPVGQDVDTGEVSFAAPGALDLLPMAGVQGGPAGTFGAGRGRRPPRGPEFPPTEVEANPRAVMGGNNPPRPRPIVTPEGFAIKGPEYAKAQQATLRAIAEEPPGVGPVDLSRPVNIDSAPQSELQRVVPARGISARMQRALENPDVETGLRESIARGIEMGADKWYHTQPIRDAFIAELGPERGAEQFRRYMDYVAATSPRSDVATNIRNASYYYSRGDEPTVKADLRYPYGHMAQNLHLQNVGTIQSGGFNVLRNPKPASFSENLQGNLVPVTVDTHAFRNIGMRTRDPEFLETSISVPNKTGKAATNLDEEDLALLNMAQRYGEVSEDGKSIIFRPQKLYQEGRLTMEDALQIPSFWASKPRENEYAAAEQLYARIGREFDLRPADTQSAAWSGAGELTGLGSPATRTFPQLFNERVEYTARMRGEDPADTLRMFIRGEKPLLSLGAGALAGGGIEGSVNE